MPQNVKFWVIHPQHPFLGMRIVLFVTAALTQTSFMASNIFISRDASAGIMDEYTGYAPATATTLDCVVPSQDQSAQN